MSPGRSDGASPGSAGRGGQVGAPVLCRCVRGAGAGLLSCRWLSRKYVVQPGDCLSSIAAAQGYASWKTIYYDPDNAAFRAKRPNPNVIQAGDVLYLPDPEGKSVAAPTEKRHRFTLSRPDTRLRLRLLDRDDRPIANAPYVLDVSGDRREGRTDGDGRLDEPIPHELGAAGLELTADPARPSLVYRWQLRLGDLDPIDGLRGVQARLNNLGFHAGPVDGKLGPLTLAGLLAFQRHCGLPETQSLDAATLAELARRHEGST